MASVKLTIDDKVVEAEEGTPVLQAALDNGIFIPHLCYHPDFEGAGACRLCIVEVEGRLLTSCRVPVRPGMVVRTRTEAVDRAVRPVVEMMIANHHITCAGCPSSGKCQLQELMARLKIDRRRLRRLRLPEETRPLDTTPPCFDYDPNKCILCGLCVRTCQKLHGESLLYFVNRGTDTAIAFYGDRSVCAGCMECVRRCPVGVLLPKKEAAA